eukprot:TRINITY_DN110451_c0_g1_i1.p1 TRINITY_DN110451_c0_g1~~TRINITY_DN110451_c0_g1_i1.p1  ORF type:complete len:104 (-),score=7.84 TRINITY_DN110451_c0_g1_i1:2-313(-)
MHWRTMQTEVQHRHCHEVAVTKSPRAGAVIKDMQVNYSSVEKRDWITRTLQSIGKITAILPQYLNCEQSLREQNGQKKFVLRHLGLSIISYDLVKDKLKNGRF